MPLLGLARRLLLSPRNDKPQWNNSTLFWAQVGGIYYGNSSLGLKMPIGSPTKLGTSIGRLGGALITSPTTKHYQLPLAPTPKDYSVEPDKGLPLVWPTSTLWGPGSSLDLALSQLGPDSQPSLSWPVPNSRAGPDS